MNSKDFSLTIITSKIFDLITVGISEVTTFLFSSNEVINITSFLSAFQDFKYDLDAGNVNAAYIINLVTDVVQGINIGIINTIYVISEIIKGSTSIAINTATSFILNEIGKISLDTEIGRNVIVFVATLGQFNLLSDFDAQALSALDSLTLGDMDFSVV